jgi:hypothetical protein
MITENYLLFRDNLCDEASKVQSEILHMLSPKYDAIRKLLTTLSEIETNEKVRDNYFLKKDNIKFSYYSNLWNFEKTLKEITGLNNPLFSDEDRFYNFKTSSYKSNSYAISHNVEDKFHSEYILPFIHKIKTQHDNFDIEQEKKIIADAYLQGHQDLVLEYYGYSYSKFIKHIEKNNLSLKIFEELKFQNILYSSNKNKQDFLDNNKEAPIFKDKPSGLQYQTFNDGTMIIHTTSNDIDIVHPIHTKRLISQLDFKFIKHEFRKSPLLIKNLVDKIGNEEHGLFHKHNSFKKLLNLKDIITDNRNFIKNSKIDLIAIFNDKMRVEDIVDYIHEEKISHEAKRNFKSFLSSKTKYLLTEDNIAMFRVINQHGFDRDELQNFVFNDISHYGIEENTSNDEIKSKADSFSYSLISYRNYLINGFDKEKQKKLMEENGHLKNIIFETDKCLLYKVNTKEESLLYGNNTWCISRKNSYETYFDSYKKDNNNQYFYYDFVEKNNHEMMIGITTDETGSPVKSYDNSNTNYLNSPNLKKIESLIKKHDKQLIKKNNKIGLTR